MRSIGRKIVIASILTGAIQAISLGETLAGNQLHLKGGTFTLRDETPALLAGGQSLFRPSASKSGLFVVQFDRPVREQDRSALEARGFEVLRYLPDHAWVVRGAASGISALRGLWSGDIGRMSSVRPEWKVDPALADLDRPTVDLWVSAWDAKAGSELASLVRRTPGARVLSSGLREVAVRAPVSAIAQWSKSDAVEWIQELPVVIPFVLDPLAEAESEPPAAPPAVTGHESGTKLMNFDKAWERGFRGEGQGVAVADTGLDTGDESRLHGDFNRTFAKGYVMGLGGETWGDPQGHGTHVMGSIVGGGELSAGNFKGGAHGAMLHAEGMWSGMFNNIMPPSDYDKLMGTPYKAGARIHSNSWGSPKNLGDYDMNAVRVDEFMWKNPDMLVLFAAGNSGVDADQNGRIDEGSISSPGTAKNVLTVGASENLLLEGGIQRPHGQLRDGDKKWGVEPLKSDTLSNNSQGLAAFSSRGPTRDGRIKPEIVAPGTNIVSTRSHYPDATVLWGAYDENYSYAGGTSMATPLTAGAAAVAREYLVKARGINSPSAALVKGTLMHSALDLFPGQYGDGQVRELPTPRPNAHEGYGRVNMDRVTSLAGETLVQDERVGVATGETKAWEVTAPAGATLRATVVWTDAPGAPSAGKALVNNLDLSVKSSRTGAVKTLGDAVNNNEMVELKRVAAGKYTVAVTGANVPSGMNGKQPFALLISVEKPIRR
jgi:subtilisin family serine protease